MKFPDILTESVSGVIEQNGSCVQTKETISEMNEFHNQLRIDASAIEEKLNRLLSSDLRDGEICRPQRLLDAMRHGVLNGGKRLRPFLVLQSGALFGADRNNLLQIAAALECVHCYSLVHDDLPAMDDDDLRRGQPTVHKAYDEATAILAGDSLLTFAFDLLSDGETHENANTRIALISALAKAAGIGGMAGGQMLDLQPGDNPNAEEIARMQSMKTGALINFACVAGGICGGATSDEIAALEKYGTLIGRAFQLADDILDVTASTDKLGKTAAKDIVQGKRTQVSTLGVDKARQMADDLVAEACAALAIFGERAQLLQQAARFVVERES